MVSVRFYVIKGVAFKKEDQIVFAMKKLIKNFNLRKKMSLKSIEYSKNFDLTFVAQKYEKLFIDGLKND